MMEKQFQVGFNSWLKHVYRATGAFELKVAPGDTMLFSRVEQHQESALFAAKHGSLVYKIPDDSRGNKPFDCFSLVRTHAFIAIMFNSKKRGQTTFYLIDIDAWLQEKQTSKPRSLSEARAAEIGYKYDLVGQKPFDRKIFFLSGYAQIGTLG